MIKVFIKYDIERLPLHVNKKDWSSSKSLSYLCLITNIFTDSENFKLLLACMYTLSMQKQNVWLK